MEDVLKTILLMASRTLLTFAIFADWWLFIFGTCDVLFLIFKSLIFSENKRNGINSNISVPYIYSNNFNSDLQISYHMHVHRISCWNSTIIHCLLRHQVWVSTYQWDSNILIWNSILYHNKVSSDKYSSRILFIMQP